MPDETWSALRQAEAAQIAKHGSMGLKESMQSKADTAVEEWKKGSRWLEHVEPDRVRYLLLQGQHTWQAIMPGSFKADDVSMATSGQQPGDVYIRTMFRAIMKGSGGDVITGPLSSLVAVVMKGEPEDAPNTVVHEPEPGTF